MATSGRLSGARRGGAASRRSVVAVALMAVALLGCNDKQPVQADAGTTEPSPNASILPAPLATGPETARAVDAGSTDAGSDAEAPPPTFAREDEALPPDLADVRETPGHELRARFRWPDPSPAARTPESNADAIERARQAATFDVRVTLAALGRMKLVLDSKRFLFPEGTELRARSEVLGHALVWPDSGLYVVIQAGALRTTLNERRADRVPLARVTHQTKEDGRALGYATERVTFDTALGRLELEQAKIPESGGGGALLCRLLVEIAGVHPETSACAADALPVRAEYFWHGGARLVFEVLTFDHLPALGAADLRTPPRAAEHRIGELPSQPPPLLLERRELRALRLRPANTPEKKDAPKDGLLVVNGDDLPRFFLVDGVPTLRLLPRGAGVLVELVRGTYSLSTRTFLGDEVEALGNLAVPGRLIVRDAPRAEP